MRKTLKILNNPKTRKGIQLLLVVWHTYVSHHCYRYVGVATFDGIGRQCEIGKDDCSRRYRKIVIVKQKEQAQIYLRASAINSDSAYRKAFDRSKSGPHYFIDIADIATFSQEIKDAEEKAFQRDTVGKNTEEKIYLEKNLQRIVVLSDNSKKWGWEILSWILPFLLLIAFFYWSMRGIGKAGGGGGGQIFNIGKSKAQLYDKNTPPSVTFNDVAGLESAKEEVVEIVDFLKNPQKYTSLGGKIPKGALLVGPPGTEKPYWHVPLPAKPKYLSSPYRVRFCGNVCRCGSFPCARLLKLPKKKPLALFLSTKSMPLDVHADAMPSPVPTMKEKIL
jgi:hypothetical protein